VSSTNPIVIKKILFAISIVEKDEKLLSTEKDAIKFNHFIIATGSGENNRN